MWLSIIVPIYNAERYLARCAESILSAIREEYGSVEKAAGFIEVLLIDNNSTDQSLALAKEYQDTYPKLFRMKTCPTPSAGAVRNFGARLARGDYLWFIDSDDSIPGSALTKLRSKYRSKPDLIMFGAERIDRNGHSVGYLSAVTPDDPNYQSRFVRYGMGPWQVLIRRAWWLDNQFAFREQVIHEDMELMSALILYTDHFDAIDEVLYYYYDNPESVLHKSKFNPHIFDVFPAMTGIHQRFSDQGAAERYHDELEWFFIWNVLLDSAKDFRAFPEGRVGFKRARKLFRDYFPHWCHNRFLRQKPLKLRLRVRLNYWGI